MVIVTTNTCSSTTRRHVAVPSSFTSAIFPLASVSFTSSSHHCLRLPPHTTTPLSDYLVGRLARRVTQTTDQAMVRPNVASRKGNYHWWPDPIPVTAAFWLFLCLGLSARALTGSDNAYQRPSPSIVINTRLTHVKSKKKKRKEKKGKERNDPGGAFQRVLSWQVWSTMYAVGKVKLPRLPMDCVRRRVELGCVRPSATLYLPRYVGTPSLDL